MSRAAPRVSVVIPCYNAAALVGETLDSVFSQTFESFEVLVVNDGSPDTPALEAELARFGDRIRYLHQENRGPGGARNTGIREARGELVAFLDGDDLWEPDHLRVQVDRFDAVPGLDLVYSDALLFGDSPHAGRTFMELSPSAGRVNFESLVTLRCLVITSCVVARREALIAAGLFDERFFHSEDFDLWARMAHRGGRLEFHRAVSARHRIHSASLGASQNSLIRGQMAVSQKLRATLALTEREAGMLDRHVRWCEAHLRLAEGKDHLIAARYTEARRTLRQAQRVLRTWKLRATLLALGIAPELFRRLLLARGALAAGAPSNVPGR
jgi:glycosyltransferase involved in cell wall biosynthesis